MEGDGGWVFGGTLLGEGDRVGKPGYNVGIPPHS